jgi:large subunit ribosomal protein L35e
MSEKRRVELIAKVVRKGKKLPLDLRAKKTRAMRRALTKEEAGKVTLRQKKRAIHFPKLKYILKP